MKFKNKYLEFSYTDKVDENQFLNCILESDVVHDEFELIHKAGESFDKIIIMKDDIFEENLSIGFYTEERIDISYWEYYEGCCYGQ